MISQIHVFVKGDVIGVGFRAWTKIQSKITHVTGWVQNVFDRPEIFGPHGGVEAVIQGEEEDLAIMLEHVKKGSPISRVDDVEVFYEEPKEIFEEFTILKSKSYQSK